METLLLYLLVEPLPSAITFSLIALLPLTALAIWGRSRMLLVVATVVCLNVGLWGGIIAFIDATWQGRFSGSDIAKLAACVALIGLGLLARNAVKRRQQQREISQRTTAPAILSLLWLLFFGAFAGERWQWMYQDRRDARRAQPQSWPGALGSALASTTRRWNDQYREARVDTLVFFGDPVRAPHQVVVWAVVPGPATDSLPMIAHHATALLAHLHLLQLEEGFPCRSDLGIVSTGTLEAVGWEAFFGDGGRRARPQATYDNHFNFYATADNSPQGARCESFKGPLPRS